MRISAREASLLAQLTDSTHRVTLAPADFGHHELPATRGNRWARRQVEDWRASHPADCACGSVS